MQHKIANDAFDAQDEVFVAAVGFLKKNDVAIVDKLSEAPDPLDLGCMCRVEQGSAVPGGQSQHALANDDRHRQATRKRRKRSPRAPPIRVS